MFRVVALGQSAGLIVDQLRAIRNYEDIEFVYCDTDEKSLMDYGRESDKHILLKSFSQCNKAIHEDNELMAVLVTDLYDQCSQQYANEIMNHLWNYADRTYCFAIIPFNAGGQRPVSLEKLKTLTDWSDITVVQDNSTYRAELLCPHSFMGAGMVLLLDLVLRHPCKEPTSDRDTLPFGIWATTDQMFMTFNAFYSNNPKIRNYYKAGTFSFLKSTNS